MSFIKRHPLKPLVAGIRFARWPLASWATLALLPGAALAGPQGEQVMAGVVNVTRPDASHTRVTQGSDKAIVNWNSFSVGGQEYVQFVQPGSTSAILNRVVGGQESQILGQISANGRVFLVNPQGVYFGAGAKVDASGLTASTLDIGNEDFMAGRYVFAKQAGAGDAAVVNAGELQAEQYAVLIGDRVRNEGLVAARLGTVVLAAGSKVSLQLDETGLVNFAVDEKTLAAQAGVENAGELLAQGGRVLMTAKVASDLVATAVNNSGVVRATGIDEDAGGAIVLRGDGGDVVNTGIVDASGATGGRVTLVSDENVRVASGAEVLATGTGAGDGGVVRLVATQNLAVETGATVRTTGGDAGGKGGFIDVSAIKGNLDVDLAAVDPGQGGTLLVDPFVLTIQDDSSLPTAGSIVTVGRGHIETKLNSGVNVLLVAENEINASGSFTINATTPATQAGNLTIATGTVSAPSFYGFFSDSASPLPTLTRSVTGDIQLGSVVINIAGDFAASAGVTTGEVAIGNVNARSITLRGGSTSPVNTGSLTATAGSVSVTGNAIATGSVLAQNTGGLVLIDLAAQTGGITVAGDLLASNAAGNATVQLSNLLGLVSVDGNVRAEGLGSGHVASVYIDNTPGALVIGGQLAVTAGAVGATSETGNSSAGIDVYADRISIGAGVLSEVLSPTVGDTSRVILDAAGANLSAGQRAIEILAGGVRALNGGSANIRLDSSSLSPSNGGISVTGNVLATASGNGFDQASIDFHASTGPISITGNVDATAGSSAVVSLYANQGGVTVTGATTVSGQSSASLSVTAGQGGNLTMGSVTLTGSEGSANAAIVAFSFGGTGGALNITGPVSVTGGSSAGSLELRGNTISVGGDITVSANSDYDTSINIVGQRGITLAGNVIARQLASSDASIFITNEQSGTIEIAGRVEADGSSANVNISGQRIIGTGGILATGANDGAYIRVEGITGVTLGTVRAQSAAAEARVLIDNGISFGNSNAGAISLTGGVTAEGAGGFTYVRLNNRAPGPGGVTVTGDVLANNTADNASIDILAAAGTLSVTGNVRANGLGNGRDATIILDNSSGTVMVGGQLAVSAGLASAGLGSEGGGSSASIYVDADRISIGNGVLSQVLSPNVGNENIIELRARATQLSTGQKAITVLAGGVRALNGSSASIDLNANGLNPLAGGISIVGDVIAAAASSGGFDNASIDIYANTGPISITGNLSATAGSEASIGVTANAGGVTVTGATTVRGGSSASLDIRAYNGGNITLGAVTVTGTNGSASASIEAFSYGGVGGAVNIAGPVSVTGGGSSGSLYLRGNTINVAGNITVTANLDYDAYIDIDGQRGITLGGNVIARQLGSSDASIYIRNALSGTINIAGRVEANGASSASVDISGQRVVVTGGIVAEAAGNRADIQVQGMTGVTLGNVRANALTYANVSLRNGYSSAGSSGTGSPTLATGGGDLRLTGGLTAIGRQGLAIAEARNEFGALSVTGPALAQRLASTDPGGGALLNLQGLSTTLNGTTTALSAVGPANVLLSAGLGGFGFGPPTSGGPLEINGAVRAGATAGQSTVRLFGSTVTVTAPVSADSVTLPGRVFAGFGSGSLQTTGKGLLRADNVYLGALGAGSLMNVNTAAGDIYLSNMDTPPESAPIPPSVIKTVNLTLDNSAFTGVSRMHTNTVVTFDAAGNPTVKGIAFSDARFTADKTLIFDTQLATQRIAVNVANGAARFDQPVLIGAGALPASFGDALSLQRLAAAATAAGKTLPLPQFNGAPTFGPNAFFAARSGLSFSGGLTFNDPDVPYVSFLTDGALDLGPGVFSINPEKQDFLAQFTAYTPGKTVHIENSLPAKLDGLGPYFTNLDHFKKLPGTTLVFGGALGPNGGTPSLLNSPLVIGQNGALNVGSQNAFFVTAGGVTGAGNLVSTGFVADGNPPPPPPPPPPTGGDDGGVSGGTVSGTIEGTVGNDDGALDTDQVAKKDDEEDKDKENVDVAAADAGDTDGVVDQKSNTGQMCE